MDIFRMNTSKDKEGLKDQLSNINVQFRYVKWLPDDFQSKKLTIFTKDQYHSIVKGSLENKRISILSYLEEFDRHVGYITEKFQT